MSTADVEAVMKKYAEIFCDGGRYRDVYATLEEFVEELGQARVKKELSATEPPVNAIHGPLGVAAHRAGMPHSEAMNLVRRARLRNDPTLPHVHREDKIDETVEWLLKAHLANM